MLLNEEWIAEEIRGEIKKILTNENSDTAYQNLWDSIKTVLRRKYIALSSYFTKKKDIPNNPTLYLKSLEKNKSTPKSVEGSN